MTTRLDRQHESDSAERAALGSMMRYPQGIDEVMTLIDQRHFRTDAHQAIFAAIVSLHTRGVFVDSVVTARELVSRHEVPSRVKLDYLNELWGLVGTGVNVGHYARLVRNHFIFRSLIDVGHRIALLGETPSASADECLGEAEKMVLGIADGASDDDTEALPTIVQACAEEIDRRSAGMASPGISTGFIDLDRVLGGGWHNSELALLAARPSCGKTALSLSFLRHAVFSGHTCLFVSLEQAKPELGERMISREAKVNSRILRTGSISPEEASSIIESINTYSDRAGRCFINTRSRSVMKIGAVSRRLKRQHNLELVVIDYLQLIEPTDRRAPRHEQVAEIGRDLKQLARDLGCPVIALAQLNRQSEGRPDTRPRLSDLRGSGELEQDADVVILLHRPNRNDEQDNVIEVIVDKNRNGECRQETLAYRKDCYLFENYQQW